MSQRWVRIQCRYDGQTHSNTIGKLLRCIRAPHIVWRVAVVDSAQAMVNLVHVHAVYGRERPVSPQRCIVLRRPRGSRSVSGGAACREPGRGSSTDNRVASGPWVAYRRVCPFQNGLAQSTGFTLIHRPSWCGLEVEVEQFQVVGQLS